mmetsp:Transcript_29046/g.74694  ORF Transcript_29046/g.74694 Transcript_29046/m.74694 type:complete len:137 (-) Transcript_29046:132-542(-)
MSSTIEEKEGRRTGSSLMSPTIEEEEGRRTGSGGAPENTLRGPARLLACRQNLFGGIPTPRLSITTLLLPLPSLRQARAKALASSTPVVSSRQGPDRAGTTGHKTSSLQSCVQSTGGYLVACKDGDAVHDDFHNHP